MLVQLLPPVSDYSEIFSILVIFGVLYFVLWYSGELMRAQGMHESIRVRKLRFVLSCLIGVVWFTLLISPISRIDFIQFPLTPVVLFLLIVVPFVNIIIDLVKQYNTRLS